MKKLFTLGALLFAGTAFAQTENVGIGTAQPDKSAILDLSSSNKGFLLPRMSESQRLNIVKPAQGLQVYQTDGTAGLYVYNGKDWENASKSVAAATDPWLRGGNAITPGEFIGTTNSEPLLFKVNNINAGRISDINTYIGQESGNSVGTGYSVGMGWYALRTNGGLGNTGIGAGALSNVTSNSNTAIGLNAMRGNSGPVSGGSNTAIGASALFNNNSGSDNVAVGQQALFNNTSGNGNLAFGAFALFSTQSTINNIAIGASSLNLLTSGSNNIGIGNNALNTKTSGSNNVAIGPDALSANTSGSGNVAIGFNAGFSESGSNKLYISNSNSATPLIYGDFSAKYVTIGDVTPALRTQGTSTGGYNLLVKGGILTEKVKVALAQAGTDWADYVFEPEYKSKMMSLEEIERFTIVNKHLPNVPSAKEMVEKGLDVSQTSKMFMEKIEELTLYIIELNKRIKELESSKK